jgi:hypothetical protein
VEIRELVQSLLSIPGFAGTRRQQGDFGRLLNGRSSGGEQGDEHCMIAIDCSDIA